VQVTGLPRIVAQYFCTIVLCFLKALLFISLPICRDVVEVLCDHFELLGRFMQYLLWTPVVSDEYHWYIRAQGTVCFVI
jgi:hypothetical protein